MAQLPAHLRTHLIKESRRYNVDHRLAEAVVQAESGGNCKARSGAGAIGCMQLMPATAKTLGVNPYVPKQNITGGVKYLGQLKRQCKGDTTCTVASYNAGFGAYSRYRGVPPFRETQAYVRKVLGSYKRAPQPRKVYRVAPPVNPLPVY